MTGPSIVFTLPILGGIPVTETVVNAWIVMAFITILSLVLSHGLKVIPSKKQVLAEKLIEFVESCVRNMMGERCMSFAPYILTLMLFSACCSLSSLFTLRPPTADLNTLIAWTLITFFLTQYHKLKSKRLGGFFKSFVEPVPLMLPLNVIGEFSNPISLCFRHFGNIAAGMVITSLLYTGLGAVSNLLLGWLTPIPFLQVGIPAVLSIYFDLFTSFMQAYIFSMLSMAYISSAME